MDLDNPLQELGLDVRVFADICYKLSMGERKSGAEKYGIVGSCYTGNIGGVSLTHRSLKDGSKGYYWTYGLETADWCLRLAISIGCPDDGRPMAGIVIRSVSGDSKRYVFSPTFEGDIERMQRDLTLARLFLD